MEAWVLFFLAISLVLSLKLLLPKLNPSSHNKPTLPPGPPAIPFVVKTTLQRTSLYQLELVVRQLHSKYGPIVALRIPFRPTVFISDRDLAHEALVHVGAALADRPSIVRGPRAIVSNHADITSSSYGPLWRSLRRNLAAEMLHPSRVKLFSGGREWALRILLDKFRVQAERSGVDRVVSVMESFQFAIFSLLVLMCFGEKIDEKAVEEVQSLQYYFLRLFVEFNPFAVLPGITKHVFRRRWNEIAAALRRQEEIFIPLIRLRQQQQRRRQGEGPEFAYSYVDSLLDVELEGGRRLREDEIASLCHEFLSGGTDTTSTVLQWIMAELVKNQETQGKLYEEIEAAVAGKEEIEEEDLQRMPYLKAVIAEALRRHPPGHFVLPHKAAKDVILSGKYLIPKGAEVHINIAELGWDGKTWEEPMAFKPERFLEGGDGYRVDITGSREIKMMPFGAGRRMCPGFGLALLHSEYFVANLVREFEWKAVEGEGVDLSERLEFTTVMKYPLRARICARRDRCRVTKGNSTDAEDLLPNSLKASYFLEAF